MQAKNPTHLKLILFTYFETKTKKKTKINKIINVKFA